MEPDAAAWHLIAGPTGAGKTTYARRLANELGGIVFSIDEWMDTLFWPDCPGKNDLPWALARIARCEQQAAAVGQQLFARGVPALFDMGLTTRALRTGWLSLAHAAGAPLILHVLDPPAEIRWERVHLRNNSQSGTFAFHVSREMFDLVETMWEPLSPEERNLYSAVHHHTR